MEKTYSVRVIQPEDTSNVIGFLTKFFFIDEPLNVETGMDLDYKSGKRCPELEAYCTSSIPEGNSVMAESSTGDIVGVCLNGGTERGGKCINDCPNEKFMKVIKILEEAGKQVDIYERYPKLNRILELKIISVHSSWRGMGVCQTLITKVIVVAREQGFQALKGDFTSYISFRVATKLGFEQIHELKYCDHFDEDTQKPVFNPPPPHTGVRVCIFKLDDV